MDSHKDKTMNFRVRRRLGFAGPTLAAAALLSFSTAGAQAPADQALVRLPAPEQPAGAIPLPVPPAKPRSSSPEEQWIALQGQPRLINVSQPTLTPVLPAPGKATGAAMIVAPGGGFLLLAMDKEGWNVARWLADHGIAAFVLKYRVRPFLEGVNERRKSGGAPDPTMALGYPPAIEDGKAALRLVHLRAAGWGINPARIGMIGFSAGARLTLTMAVAPGVDVRPDFVAAIYPPMDNLEVPADAPPLFTAIAADDTTTPVGELGLVRSWHAAKRPVEFHLYEKGGHGFGVPGVPETTTIAMMNQLELWLNARGLLDGSAGNR
jgi:acetyl esterase/lipase